MIIIRLATSHVSQLTLDVNFYVNLVVVRSPLTGDYRQDVTI